jgi:hypothetical protein
MDDGNLLGPRPLVARIVQLLKEFGPEIGYHINVRKGAYLLGQCQSLEHALATKKLVALRLGLSDQIIRVHPANRPDTASQYGVKLLGSPVGSFEFVDNFLRTYLLELGEVAKELIAYPDIQGRYLMFVKCFQFKPVHLCRTLHPSVLDDFCVHLEALKLDILVSILNCQREDITEEQFHIFNLSAVKGGLDMRLYGEVSRSAYVASLLDYNAVYGGFLDEVANAECNSRFVRRFRSAVCSLPSVNNLAEGINVLRALKYSAGNGSVQHQIHLMIEEKRVTEMVRHLKERNPQQLVWWQSQQNPESGRFLATIPKFPKFKMTNKQFVLALRYRGYMRIAGVVDGMRCCCSRHPFIDVRCHHLATSCPFGGERNDTHNELVGELNGILRYCGLRTKVEERRVFGDIDIDNNLRPDITIAQPEGQGVSKLLLDVGVTSPLSIASREIGSAANNMAARKIGKYRASCAAAGFSFKPIVFESTGYMHKDALDFLHGLAKEASEVKHIPAAVLYNYFVKRLSFRLQCGIANSIGKRLANVRSQCQCKASDPTFAMDVVTSFDVAC